VVVLRKDGQEAVALVDVSCHANLMPQIEEADYSNQVDEVDITNICY